MVIVEYCKYGNLSNHLRSKRGDFVIYKVNKPPERGGSCRRRSVTPLQPEHFLSRLRLALPQSRDGKAASLSDPPKRRLESVASTGSSLSSGFVEDKSCDSEEEEEG